MAARRTPTLRTWAGRLVGAVALVVVGTAAPAAADTAEPGNFRSEVTAITGTDVVDAEIKGGDAFLEVSVDAGHEVLVPGYQDEPYLRVGADGTVSVNDASPTRWLNDDREGATAVPADAGIGEPPRWREVASGGSYSWHDHRTHWMSANLPAAVEGADETVEVQDWEVPIVVDGVDATISGTLEWTPDTPLPLGLLPGVVAAAVVGVLAWRRERVAAVAVLAAGLAAAVVEGGEWGEQPADVRTVGVGVMAAAAAVVLGIAATALAGRTRSARPVALLAAAVVVGWSLTRLDSLDEPVLPTRLPAWVERAGVAAALGVGLAVAAVLVVRTVQSIEPLDDDPADAPAPSAP